MIHHFPRRQTTTWSGSLPGRLLACCERRAPSSIARSVSEHFAAGSTGAPR